MSKIHICISTSFNSMIIEDNLTMIRYELVHNFDFREVRAADYNYGICSRGTFAKNTSGHIYI
jgi:hypothetical protein